VLLIEDNAGDARLVAEALRGQRAAAFEVVVSSRLSEGLDQLKAGPFDVALVDLSLPDSQGLDTFLRVRERSRSVPILILTGLEDEAMAVRAVGEGAQDFVLKRNLVDGGLGRAILYALSRQQLVQQLEEQLHATEESQARYRAVMDAAMDAIITVDGEGVIRLANRASEALLGFAAGDLVGKRFAEIVPSSAVPESGPVVPGGGLSPGAAPAIVPAAVVGVGKGGRRVPLELSVGEMELDGRPAFTAVLRDISARRKAEEVRSHLASLVEFADIAIVSSDRDGLITSFNPAAGVLFRWRESEVVGKPLLLLVPPERRERVRDQMEAVMAGAPVEIHETTRWRKDSLRVDVVAGIAPVRDADGVTSGAVSTFRDLTDLRRAESALRHTRERYRALIENSEDAVVLANEAGTIVYASASLQRLLGYTPEEVLGRHMTDFTDPSEVGRSLDRYAEVVRTSGEVLAAKWRARHRDGRLRWMEGHIANMLGDPAVLAVVFNLRDATARIEAEEALERSEQRYRLVAQASRDALWDWNLLTNEVEWTEGFQGLLGWGGREKAMARDSFYTMIHPEDRERVAGAIHATVEGRGTSWGDEYRLARADGTYAHVSARGFVVRAEDGKAVRIVGALGDVTALKALDAFRESLVDVISHEFRTPVTVIQGYSELLAAAPGKLQPEQVAKARERIERASRHLSFLLSSVRELARLRVGKLDVAPVPVRTESVVAAAVGAAESRRGDRGRPVEVEVAPGAEALMADEPKLVIALVEVLDNAVKFSPEGSPVTVRAEPSGENVLVAVRDRGAGIPPERADELTKPFTQQDMTTVRRAGGAGLGLALASGLVRAMGGSLSTAPRDGGGTEVRITLPRATPGAAGAAGATGAAAEPARI